MKDLLLKHRRKATVAFSVVLFGLVYAGSFSLRYGGVPPANSWGPLLYTLPFVALFKTILFVWYRLDRGTFRYASFDDLIRILKASTISSGGLLLTAVLVYRLEGFPRSVFLIDWMGTILAFGGQRFSVRALLHGQIKYRKSSSTAEPKTRTLIAGAGNAGVLALRELRNNASNREIVGFVDDDPHKQGALVHGEEVIGSLSDVPSLIEEHAIDEVLIAMPSAPKKVIRELTQSCSGQVSLRILPAMIDFITGELDAQQIRDVKLEDLLGREPIKMDHGDIREDLRDKCVLVTGAAGSIGSELARQIARYEPGTLILLDMAESPLFEIDQELENISALHKIPVVGDIRNAARLSRILKRFEPDYIYHAAAYKHVPLMEDHPVTAVRNNVLGTRNLAKAALDSGVKKFVMVSTDKAVSPKNIMGATKRACELLITEFSGNGTDFMAVRFGNVLGSNGSVIPVFRQQIEQGGPVTVTHPEATRYFMTIPEAVELVLQAATVGENGDVFILEMGEPVRILDLAHNMITLSGMSPGEDIDVEFIGLRPGEKLHEELATPEEELCTTGIPGLCKLEKPDGLPESKSIVERLGQLERAATKGDAERVESLLFNLVDGQPPVSQPTTSRSNAGTEM